MNSEETIMSVNLGIYGSARMGRQRLRAGWDRPELKFARINEIATAMSP
jgi:hypothetical protein